MTVSDFIPLIRKALKGEEHDYTSGSIPQAVVLLAIPMILELSLESVFAIVDMFFVSKLGANAIATVGLTESIITIVYSIAIGLSTGATAIVARRIGEKDPAGAARAAGQALSLSVVVSIVMGLIGWYYAADLLRLMGASPEVVAEGTGFAKILLGTNLVIVLLFIINGIFRGAGDAAMAMKSLWLASAANIVFCPIMIHFYGLDGAAIATVFGRGLGVVYQLWHLFGGKGVVSLKLSDLRIDMPIVTNVVKVASPASMQFLIGSGSWIILTRIVAEVGGTAASAGYQIAARCFMTFMLPVWGMSNAAATLVGQNLGAKQIDRAEQSVFITMKYSAIIMGLATLFFVALPHTIVTVFTEDAVVASYATLALRVFGVAFIFLGIGMVYTQAFNGAGDTKTPTLINFLCLWLFETPFAYSIAIGLGYGYIGVLCAVPASQFLFAVLAYWFFKRGRWKEVKV